jgi:hypothetical protein
LEALPLETSCPVVPFQRQHLTEIKALKLYFWEQINCLLLREQEWVMVRSFIIIRNLLDYLTNILPALILRVGKFRHTYRGRFFHQAAYTTRFDVTNSIKLSPLEKLPVVQ